MPRRLKFKKNGINQAYIINQSIEKINRAIESCSSKNHNIDKLLRVYYKCRVRNNVSFWNALDGFDTNLNKYNLLESIIWEAGCKTHKNFSSLEYQSRYVYKHKFKHIFELYRIRNGE